MTAAAAPQDAARAAETAARASYGRILAVIAARSGDIAAAEDALADAFATALKRWPADGVPANPEGWLVTAARNRLIDMQRRAARQAGDAALEDIAVSDPEREAWPDERLKLMLVCAHPAIAPDLHAALMLQCVLGVQSADIARAFRQSPAALSQQLVRAKRKIRDAKVPFAVPDRAALPGRIAAVREAIYAAHALDWLDPGDALGGEALFLARLLAELAPDDPETLGLAALIGFGHARRAARISGGVLVPLSEQDIGLWDAALEAWSLKTLTRAKALGEIGRFQIEAAIQSVHAHRRVSGRTDWRALERLYAALARISPSAGGLASHAAVIGEAFGPEAGLVALDRIDPALTADFQPAAATRAHLLACCGRRKEAAEWYRRAIALTREPPLQRWLQRRLDALEGEADS